MSFSSSTSLWKNKGLVSLDALRGAAALMVAIPHYFLFSGVKNQALEFISVQAVEIFFVLSGYVLAKQMKYCFATKSWEDLWTFLVRRWMRTLPPFLLALVLLSALTGNILTRDFFGYMLFVRNLFDVPAVNDYFAVAWSLSVEEWFYIVFPLAAYLFLRSGARLWLYLTVFIGVLFLAKLALTVFAPDLSLQVRRIVAFRLDAIAFGFLLHGNAEVLIRRFGAVWLALLAAVVTLGAFAAFSAQWSIAFVYTASASAVLVLLSFLSNEARLRSSNTVRRIAAIHANISYSLYLNHTFVFLILSNILSDSLLWARLALYLAVLLLICVAIFLTFERPILDLRPEYASKVPGAALGVDVRVRHVLGILATNFVVFLAVVNLTERLASAAMWSYQALRNLSAEVTGLAKIEIHDKAAIEDPELRVYSSPDVFAEMQRHASMTGTPYRYESYVTYAYRPYHSRLVNIDDAGRRLNSTEGFRRTAREVWVFGSSPVFGVTNADDETVSAYIEKKLNLDSGGSPANVSNFGVVGYTAWQDFLNLSLRLAKGSKPDVVVIINGHNDYNLAWLSDAPDCQGLLETAVGSAPVLRHAWESRASGTLIEFPGVEDKARYFFQNTSALLELIEKMAEKIWSSQHLGAWKADYAARAADRKRSYEKCGRLQQDAYLRTMSGIAELGAREGFLVIFAHQPTIFSTGKMLMGVESTELQHYNETFFAMTDEEIAETRSVPSYRLKQPHLWNKSLYRENYHKQKQRLMSLASQKNVVFVDLDREIEAAPEQVIFSSPIHYTFRGARLIGEKIASEIVLHDHSSCGQVAATPSLRNCQSSPP